MVNRLTRTEAMKLIGCADNKMRELEKSGLLDGTFYNIGRIKYYITEKLEQWIYEGGENSARKRKIEHELKGSEAS